MNEPISLNINNINNIIIDYNNNRKIYELELVYNYDISEKILKKILIFLNKKYKNITKKNNYILDVSTVNDKNHRLTINSENSDIINSHCLFEKENMDNNNIFPENYKLEYKESISKNYINQLNCRLNIKKENDVNDDEIKNDFIKNYSKFKKTYRFKNRISYIFDNYRIDITIVKQSSGQNILLSNISDVLEKIELEIEYTNSDMELTQEVLLEMFQIITNINQYNNEGYFNISRNEKNEINKNYGKLLEKILNKKNDTIGPKPLAFTKKTMKNMLDVYPENEKNNNTLYYKITEKADGERYFMYIDMNSTVYLIGTDKNVLKTGLKLNNTNYDNTVCDGELLYYKNEENKYVYEYKYFDIYIIKNKEVYSNNLDIRIEEMQKLNNELLNSIKYIDNNFYIKCEIKEYYDISDFDTLLDKDTTGTYNIDGIIFMPSLHLTNINNKSYKSILKYKPLEENTIDVLVENKMLYCGYNLKKDYVKSEIMCIKPYIVDIHKKEIKKQNADNSLETMDYKLLNNKIVEVVYNVENECFIFKKIRHDKTEEYKKTNRITANNFYIVNEILEYTFNSINRDTIKNINIKYIESELKKVNKSGYYKTDKVDKIGNSEKNLRKLQNKIKTKLINDSLSILENNDTFTYIKALDLACGRGGDLLKLINTNFIDNNSNNSIKKNGGIKLILGIDNSSVNIEYSEKYNNNARGRYLEYKNDYINKSSNNKLPDIYENNNVYYITGDLSLYEDEDDVEESYEKIMNDLQYTNLTTNELLDNNDDFKERTIYDKTILDSINSKHGDNIDIFEEKQFEFIQCQFAIHYFDLEAFCKYVDLQLKPGGVFVCTFMEKQYVNELFEKNNSDIVSGNFWSLRKSKTNPENKIDVKFGTLEGETYLEENFVSENMLIEIFKQYNINPYIDTMSQIVSFNSAINPILNFRDYVNETDAEFEFNKLYKGIIFQKNLQNSTTKEQIKKLVKK